MKPFVVGIAGGSGSGKTSVALALQAALPGLVTIFHMDDYFRPAAEVPLRASRHNWDDPRALYYSQMAKDLAHLKAGESVIINTKSPLLNPDFPRSGQRIPISFQPKPLLIVEGAFALYYPKIRQLLDLSIYLDAPFHTHVSRREHSQPQTAEHPDDYRRLVLRPMHDRFVGPSKVHAEVRLDAAQLNQKQVVRHIMTLLAPQLT